MNVALAFQNRSGRLSAGSVANGFGLSPKQIENKLRQLAGPNGVAKAKSNGGDRKSLAARANQNDIIILKQRQYGTSAAYRIAVLKRDHPRIAARYHAGESGADLEHARRRQDPAGRRGRAGMVPHTDCRLLSVELLRAER